MLDRWISGLQTEALQETGLEPGDPKLTKAVDGKIYQVTSAVSELVHGFEFARLLSLYYHSYVEGTMKQRPKWSAGSGGIRPEAGGQRGTGSQYPHYGR